MPIILDGSDGIDSPDLNITGVGARITGDFSNATVANRAMFQTNTTNGATRLGIIPNGTATSSVLQLYANSDPTNTSALVLESNSVESNIRASVNGTGTYLPITFSTSTLERMRITEAGEVWIARTTDAGAFNLQCGGTGVWGAGAYTNGSDARIKDEITPIDSCLDVVCKLKPVTYKYKETWSEDQSTQSGFIAQDLLEALKDTNYKDGIVNQTGEYMSVAYQNIIPILTKAIQEQQLIIKSLTDRIDVLENKQL